MRVYLLAVIFPPLAVLLCGKPIQALINFVLTCAFYIPGMIHAILVVSEKKKKDDLKQLAKIMKK